MNITMKKKITLLLAMLLMLGTGSVWATVVTTVNNVDTWKAFVASVKAGDDYSSITVTLTADVTLPDNASNFAMEYMAGGDSSHPFNGTFDGGGYTISYTKTGLSENYQALFRHVDGATIKNLNTSGELSSSGSLVAGIIGNVKGTVTLDNCSCNMTLTSTNSTDCRIGGLVARCADTGASITITNCMFNGTISAGQSGRANGIVGWSNNTTVNLSSCFVNPKSVENGGQRFSNVRTSESNLWYTGSSFSSSTGGTEATTPKLESGEVAYSLQNNQATQYWGQTKLNTSIAATLPELTSDASKKVIKLTMSNGSTTEYANANGAMPSPVDKGALSFWNGKSGDPFTSLSEDATISRNFSKYPLVVTLAGATTLVLPVAVSTLPTGVKAYDLTYTSGDKVTATEVYSITAHKPVLINANEGTYVFESSNSSEITYDTENAKQNGALYGVYTDTYKYVPANSYVLQNKGGVLGFYQVENANTVRITSFRAYLTAQGGSAAPARLNITFDDNNTTGIKNVSEQTNIDDAIYTLNGTQVDHPVKGLYIKNGKKFIVK